MSDSPRLSVIVCTRNRASMLAQVLKSLDADPSIVDREILVVDNGSTDDTMRVFEESCVHGRRHRRRIWEQTAGLSWARNTGVRAARGEIVAFLDDDVRVLPGWADAIVAPFADPAVQGVGGHVDPDWPSGRPAWFHDELLPAVGSASLGSQAGSLTGKLYPVGANMAYRRALFDAIPTFTSRLGRVGHSLMSAEEVEFAHRVRCGGGVLWFAPDARVLHHVPPSRATREYVLRRRRADGCSIAAWDRIRGGSKAMLIGLAARTLIGYPRDALGWLLARACAGADGAFRFQCRLVKHAGYAAYCLRPSDSSVDEAGTSAA